MSGRLGFDRERELVRGLERERSGEHTQGIGSSRGCQWGKRGTRGMGGGL